MRIQSSRQTMIVTDSQTEIVILRAPDGAKNFKRNLSKVKVKVKYVGC